MNPIRTPKTTGIYGAPRGLEAEIGGLPFYREADFHGTTTVYSVWTFTDAERAWIAKGHANLVIGILGMEPIPPIAPRCATVWPSRQSSPPIPSGAVLPAPTGRPSRRATARRAER